MNNITIKNIYILEFPRYTEPEIVSAKSAYVPYTEVRTVSV